MNFLNIKMLDCILGHVHISFKYATWTCVHIIQAKLDSLQTKIDKNKFKN